MESPNLGRTTLFTLPIFPRGTHFMQDMLDRSKIWKNLAASDLPIGTFQPIAYDTYVKRAYQPCPSSVLTLTSLCSVRCTGQRSAISKSTIGRAYVRAEAVNESSRHDLAGLGEVCRVDREFPGSWRCQRHLRIVSFRAALRRRASRSVLAPGPSGHP